MEDSEAEKNKIIAIYRDPEQGLSSAQAIYKKLNKWITLKKIKFVLWNIDTKQIHNAHINKSNFIPIVNEPNSFQIDLTFFEQYKAQNKNFIGLLTSININSRKAYVYPFKTKSMNEMTRIINNFINEADPKIIESDWGNEFINTSVQKLFSDYGIKYISFDKATWPNAMAKIERFNKTIRDKITSYMTTYKTNNWINVIDKLIKNYNNTEHRTTGMKPNEVDTTKEKEILTMNYIIKMMY